ncbi:unannotated protein [freshwater metagenome]|uniref:histidine kinase n=1 Tax=freshwater metagenome TaxID=449393 RepID=A0A6J7V4W5_9ZZZZ|nr:HAMP domain-containing protein [Actinomycetota bacterium]
MALPRIFSLQQWSLRGRLVATSVALTAVALIIVDVSTAVVLRNYLIHKVDDQLRSVAGGPVLNLGQLGPGMMDGDTDQGRGRRVPSTITVTLLNTDGSVAGTIGGGVNEKAPSFTGLTLKEVTEHKSLPWTWHQEGFGGDHRVITRLTASGGIVVVSIALADVNNTLVRTGLLLLLLGLVVLGLLLLIGRRAVSLGLRPLDNVEKTAAAIASGDLSARLPDESATTEVGRLNTALNQMLARIEESFDVKSASEDRLRRFVADASHELRTPLTTVRGFAELHRQGAIQGEAATTDAIRRIERESIRMSALVEDLLMLARLDQQRDLELETVDLRSIVDEVVEAARVSSQQHVITSDLPSEDVLVNADSRRFNQALSNLMVNARTYTPAGTAIHVSLRKVGDDALVSVHDQGPGLSEEQATRIFERFYRADSSRTRSEGQSEGSGLGLSIVDAVMKAHGGSADVVSKLGEGATFILRLPLLVLE